MNIHFLPKHFKKGVTLLELVVYVSLFSLIIPFMFDSLQSVSGVRERTLILNEAVTSCMFASSLLIHEVQQSQDLIQPNQFGNTASQIQIGNLSGSIIEMNVDSTGGFIRSETGQADQDLTSSLLSLDSFTATKYGSSDDGEFVQTMFNCTPVATRFSEVSDSLPFEIGVARRLEVPAQP